MPTRKCRVGTDGLSPEVVRRVSGLSPEAVGEQGSHVESQTDAVPCGSLKSRGGIIEPDQGRRSALEWE